MEEKKLEVVDVDQTTENTTDTLVKQLEEANSKYMLLYADFENYKKRITKEKDELRNNTKVSMLTAILDMDNDIALAVKNIKDETAKEGVQLIAGKLESFLKGQGIETIQTETYDEDLHEVVTVIGEGKNVIDVISKGYTLSGKPFRYPKIVIG